jgi:RND family efflux transporter MFP subunit
LIRRTPLLACCAGIVATGAALAQPALPPEYDCLIEARQALDIRSPVEGVIETVYVQRGASVKKGQTLAMLFSGPERAALDLARSRAGNEGEIKSAEARVELTRKKYERAEELVKKNFVSANARDEAEAEYRLAAEQLRVAQENRRLAELEVKRAEEIVAQREIRSPVTGVVVEVLLRPGELTSSNQKDPIVKLIQIDPLNVELILPVQAYGRIRAGQRAWVMPEAPVGGKYIARVEVVDSMFDAASGTFGVRLELANPRGVVPGGIRCQVDFPELKAPERRAPGAAY